MQLIGLGLQVLVASECVALKYLTEEESRYHMS